MFATRFDLRAVKKTEHLLQVTITKDGVTEEEIHLGIGSHTIVVDMEKHEIRRHQNGEVLAKFGDVELPYSAWSVLCNGEAKVDSTFGIQAITPETPSGTDRARPYFGDIGRR